MMMIMPCLSLIKSRQQCPHKREKSRKKAAKSSRGTPDTGKPTRGNSTTNALQQEKEKPIRAGSA